MARVCDIYDIINAVAPFSTALDFDNVGLLVGDGKTVVTRALLALDITPNVVAEAASMNANLIISHHPVIFHPVKSLGPQDMPYQLASRGIAALCCHTNLDLSPVCGVNVALGSKLGCGTCGGKTCSARTASSIPVTWRSPWTSQTCWSG